tara:strand:+ start:15997 stop:16971 length:975 start_codon:yes stop_codon:yes gene_type:complete
MSEQNSLINACVLDGNGGARDIDWDGIDSWQPSDGALWVHLDRHGAETETWLRTHSGLRALHVDALLAEETQPRAAIMGGGILITLRGVNLNPGADPEDMVSLRIWVDGHRMITVRLRRLMATTDVRDRLVDGTGPIDTGDLLRAIAGALTQRMSPVISDLNDEIDALEKSVIDETVKGLRKRLNEIRREAIALHRYLAPQRDAVAHLSVEGVAWLSADHRLGLRESADHVARIVEDLDAMRDRAAVIQDEIANRIAEHTNRNMYTLSVVAALMLPLGVITGLFGMNVGGIPLADNKSGFLAITLLLSAVVILQVLIFRRLRWL